MVCNPAAEQHRRGHARAVATRAESCVAVATPPPAGAWRAFLRVLLLTRAPTPFRVPGRARLRFSGNTGIALAMAAAIKGYKMKLIMPANMSEERRLAMSAYGAELISVPGGQMELARDLAKEMEARGEGVVLDQFANGANPLAHTRTTGPELWEQTGGRITHFVTSMGTTGTAMGTSGYLKEQNKDVQIVGLQPAAGASIPGIRRWPAEYMPSIFDASRVDETLDISQEEAEETMRALARCEGIFAGVSSGGCVAGALRVAAKVENATIVCIICDRGVRFRTLLVVRVSSSLFCLQDRYLSTGCFVPKPPAWATVATFPHAAARLLGLNAPHVLFTSGRDAETGELWCPDCRRSVPAVVEAAAAAGVTLLVVDVGARPEWKGIDGHPPHVFRSQAGLELRCIPTLLAWDVENACAVPGAPRLEQDLEKAEDAAAVTRLCAAFFARA